MKDSLRCVLHGGSRHAYQETTIFEIGPGRVGSRSLTAAARALGVSARHGFSGCPGCVEDALWKLKHNRIDYDLYKTCHYSGNVAIVHWRELAKEYPEAKFILPERDMEKWLYSCRKHERWIKVRGTPGTWTWEYVKQMWGLEWDAEHRREKWTQEVKDMEEILGERLCKINVFETPSHTLWKQLAKVLGVDVPETLDEFPKYKRARVR